jgi:hypothetical protein
MAMERNSRWDSMAKKPTCPRADERKAPPQDDELIDPECWDCPLLMREVDSAA